MGRGGRTLLFFGDNEVFLYEIKNGGMSYSLQKRPANLTHFISEVGSVLLTAEINRGCVPRFQRQTMQLKFCSIELCLADQVNPRNEAVLRNLRQYPIPTT